MILLLTISTILGDTEAFNERRMPYQVLVHHRIVDKEVADCSGVIVGRRHILITAKCVEYITAADLSIKYGYKDGDELYRSVEIERIVKHPEFKTRYYVNNIAVLITKTEMNFKENIAETIEMADVKEGESLFASGWGTTNVSQEFSGEFLLYFRIFQFQPLQFSFDHICRVSHLIYSIRTIWNQSQFNESHTFNVN